MVEAQQVVAVVEQVEVEQEAVMLFLKLITLTFKLFVAQIVLVQMVVLVVVVVTFANET